MILLAVTDILGRFHPVLVHLPIGILLIACFFQLFAKKYPALKPALQPMVFWGMLTAVASCVTGYMLSLSGDYEGALLEKHQWLGIATALASLALYFFYKYASYNKGTNILSVVIILLITITGHLGGSLTHGENFLTEGFSVGAEHQTLKPIPNIQEAVLYTDVVQPVLEAKCYSCHGSNKQKGKLRLDAEPGILKGGKDGPAIVSGKPDESELIKRLLLPLSDEDHMPPKEKPQLSPNEVAILSWWVSTGNSFTKKVKELPQTDKIKMVLSALQSGSSGATTEEQTPDVPEEEVGVADPDAVKKLTDAGVMVVPVSKEKNYLLVSFVTATANAASLVQLLEPLKKQIVWLKLDNSNISDSSLKAISKLSNLTRLYLSNTAITDAGLAALKDLKQLQALNLMGTKVTNKGVEQLKDNKLLRTVNLYKTAVDKANWAQLKQVFPKTILDSGGYTVPTLATDTTIVTVENAGK